MVLPVSKFQTQKSLENNYNIVVNNAPTSTNCQANKFSQCTDQTRALIDGIQCRKKGTSPTECKNYKL
jgi:hypothetical protein